MKVNLIPVRIGNGVVIMHTREQFELLVRGVDLEAAQQATAPIALEEDE